MAHPSDPTVECLTFLLTASRNLFAIREVENLSIAITDSFIALTGAERGYLLLSEAGPDNLLPVCARGAGGLRINPPERRMSTFATRAIKDPSSTLLTSSTDGRTSAASVLTLDKTALAVAVVDGQLKPGWTQQRFLDILAQHAALALDNARFFERASNDLLTGLPNHSYFDGAVNKFLRGGLTGDSGGGVLLIDLDTFKRVNQAAGADVGDKALIDVAHTLRDTLGADGLVARYGSDKFAVLLTPGPEKQLHLRLRDAAERARAAVGAKIFSGVQLSCCIGGVFIAGEATKAAPMTCKDFVGHCDRVLAIARARGMGQVEVVSSAVSG